MRRLRDFQLVALQLGERVLPCRTVAVAAIEAVLEPHSAAAIATIDLPADAALTFDHRGHPVMLAGRAASGPVPGTLRFRITDAVGLRELRLRPRLRAELPVRVTPVVTGDAIAGPTWNGVTVDLSAGGVVVAGYPGARGARVAIAVDVPGLAAPVRAGAVVIRRRPEGAAMRFEDLDPTVAAALDEVIFAVRRRLAREAFAA